MKKIKLGNVGLGYGEWIINDIVNNGIAPQFEVAGVCDLELKRVEHITKTYNVTAYDSLEDILADVDVPVIGLFTPPSGRAKLIEQIIDAGRDVITTKPFELDVAAAQAVLKKARRLGRKIMLNSPSPTPSPDMQQILKWADEYNLGKKIACRIDTWVSYREKYDGTWYDDAELCPVAPIFRLGIYLINDLTRLLGKAKSVQVLKSRIFTERPTPDNAQMGILFESGAIANVFASFCVEDKQYYKKSMILNFERGTVTRNLGVTNHQQTAKESILSLVTLDSQKEQIVKNITIAGSSEQYPWDEFYSILCDKAEIPINTDAAIVEGIRIINAMIKEDRGFKV